MSAKLKQWTKLGKAIVSDLFWTRPANQEEQQLALETELFTHCDDLEEGQVGVHWCVDWVFEPGQSLSLAIGRVIGSDSSYTQIALKQQTDERGLIYELIIPFDRYQFDHAQQILTVSYEGEADLTVQRLGSPEQESERRWVRLELTKETTQGRRPWSSVGELVVYETEGGTELCHWQWDYRYTEIFDRPDYHVEALLGALDSDAIPGGIGHFIPAMSGKVDGEMTFTDDEGSFGCDSLQGGYIDGNFSHTAANKAERLVHDHWGWLVIPRLWTVDGVPVEHMFMAGFFRAPLLGGLLSEWSGIVLWRSDDQPMSAFSLKELFATLEVRHHNQHYLDMTIIPPDRAFRITFRIWSDSMVSQFVPPGSQKFRDHQDLLADAYVVIEENALPRHQRRFRSKWRVLDRLVTNIAGVEFGERESAIGSPDYPAHGAVPSKPDWFREALARIPAEPFSDQESASRLADIQPTTG